MLVEFDMTQEMKKLLESFRKNTLTEAIDFGGGTTKYVDALTVIKLMLSERAPGDNAAAKVLARLDQILNFATQVNKIQIPDMSSEEDIMAMQNKISNKIVQQRIQDELQKIGLEPELISSFLEYIREVAPAPEFEKTAPASQPADDNKIATNKTQISSAPKEPNPTVTKRRPKPKPLADTQP